MESQTEAAETEALWRQLSPMLDEALLSLRENDRRAVLLRFFEGQSLSEVGQGLAIGEDAARKRISRSLEKLRDYFVRRGVSSTTALIAGAISTYSVHAAPAALAKAVSVAAVAKGAVLGGSTLSLIEGALKFMAWTKAQTAAVGLVVVGLAAVTVVQHRAQVNLREENRLLQQQMSALDADNQQLSNLVAEAKAAPLTPSNPSAELLRLRGEVGVLRQQSNQLQQMLAQTRTAQPRSSTQAQEPAPPSEDYPKTAEAATRGIFEALSRGDLEGFFTNFGEPGVPKEMYDKMFNNPQIKSYLNGLQVLSVGQPTNSFGPNMWFVPYRIRLQDGTEKEMRLHIAQDPRTQKWIFKGGI
jgi:Sigma-70, region 4